MTVLVSVMQKDLQIVADPLQLSEKIRSNLIGVLRLIVLIVLSLGANKTFSNEYELKGADAYALLSGHLSVLEENKPLTIEDILTNEISSQFVPLSADKTNFGFVDTTYWFRVSVRDETEALSRLRKWFFVLDFNFIDHVEFHYPVAGGYEKVISGDRYPFNERAIPINSHLFPVSLRKGETTTFYLRIQTTTSLQVPLEIYTPEHFAEKYSLQMYWQGAFYGVMLALILYNFFIFTAVRDRTYIYYILYISGMFVTNMAISGLAPQFLWPQSPYLANYGFTFVSHFTSFFALLFTRNFLRTGTYPKLFRGAINFLSVACVVAFFLPLILPLHHSSLLAVFVPLPVCLFILATGFYGTFKKQRRAYFFLTAWMTLLLGIVIRASAQLDILPLNIFTAYASQIGAVVEAILLSLALADRINTDKSERVRAIVAAYNAKEEKRKMSEELVFRSSHDPLTGSPNRLFFSSFVQKQLDDSTYQNSKLVICTIHLSNFHNINFTLGHQAGDQIIIEATNSFNRELASWQEVFLLNEIESNSNYISVLEGVYLAFMLVCNSHDDERQLVERIATRLSKSFYFREMTLDLGVFIGISAWPEDNNEADGLIRKSMIAVRAAKWSNIPILKYDAHIDQYSESRLALMGQLSSAINNNEMQLYYQPKIDLLTNQVVSLEALIRWNHPTRGMLSPAEFIDIAESTGVIHDITQWVISEALRFCMRLRENGIDISIAVNVSVQNLLNEHFASSILEVITRFNLPASSLVVEVTESSVIEDMEQTIESLEKLSNQGVQISLDDFGTGYSSLSYLKKLPITELKIDRSFVSELCSNKEDRIIVETTLAIANELNLKIVAEGIEDKATLDLLSELGCEIGQGYFIKRPSPDKDLLMWLLADNQYSARKLKKDADTRSNLPQSPKGEHKTDRKTGDSEE